MPKKPKAGTRANAGLHPEKTETGTDLKSRVPEILERLAKGESLNAICKDDGMPAEGTVRGWVIDDVDGIAAKYARARELQAEFWADDIIRLSDDCREGTKVKTGPHGEEVTTGDMVERTRLQVEARKWLLSKLFPKRYGEKIDVHNTGDVTIKFIKGGKPDP